MQGALRDWRLCRRAMPAAAAGDTMLLEQDPSLLPGRPWEQAAAEPLLGGRTGGHAASQWMFRAVCCVVFATLFWKAGCEGHAGGNFTLSDGVDGSAENVPRSILGRG